MNGDFTALDGILGGNVSIALAAATTLLLSVPATGSVSPTAGPNQSQNAVVKFSGTLTGNVVIQLTLPRKYVFDNQCAVATSYIQIAPASGTGTAVGLPPGRKTEVAYDGTNVDFVGGPYVGEYLDMAVATTQPWMTACTKPPLLPCDGATYSTASFPALGNMLGSTFGGNGITTFGLPDFRNRFALPIDSSGQGRVTTAGSGFDGTTLGATGGNQLLTAHNHAATVTDQGHQHNGQVGNTAGTGPLLGGASNFAGTVTVPILNATTGITVANASTGSGASQNMPPGIVFGCRFIKT